MADSIPFRRLHADGPAISTLSAAALSVAYTLLYVLPFYLSAKTRPSPTILRDSPAVIRARIRAVAISTALTTSLTGLLAILTANLSLQDTLHLLGLWPIDLGALLHALMLVALLFLGPLFESGIVQGNWRAWLLDPAGLHAGLTSWQGLRNYVAGPLTEELAFRAAVLPLHVLAGVGPAAMVFATPLYFGIAHVHHCYEFCLTHPGTPLLPAVLRSVFQFTYTSVFGAFAAFLYLRTGCVWACVLTHAFCNWMGLPRLWGRVEGPEPLVAAVSVSVPIAAAPAAAATKPARPTRRVSPAEQADSALPVWWTVAYYVFLVLGAWGFRQQLWKWTETETALVRL